jgi:hypothetical protein
MNPRELLCPDGLKPLRLVESCVTVGSAVFHLACAVRHKRVPQPTPHPARARALVRAPPTAAPAGGGPRAARGSQGPGIRDVHRRRGNMSLVDEPTVSFDLDSEAYWPRGCRE